MSLITSPNIFTRNLNQKGPLVILVPGWAGLGKHLLHTCPWQGPTAALSYTSPHTIAELHTFIQDIHIPFILIGFSYGGFVAASLMQTPPPKLHHCYLVGICPNYPVKTIQFIQSKLLKNHQQYLRQFYQAALSNNDYARFKKEALDNTLSFFSYQQLTDTLTHLSQLSVMPHYLQHKDISLIHGQNDAIAPLPSVQRLLTQDQLNQRLHIINTRHFPFYSQAFWDIALSNTTTR